MSSAANANDWERQGGPGWARHPFWSWHPGWIVLMVFGFIVWWPIGLAILAFTFWSRRMACWSGHGYGRWQNKMDRMQQKMDSMRMSGGWGSPPSSGNHAFDEYRIETLRRLEQEQREFKDFLERLRFAKDKTEFDQFMAERRNRPAPEAPQQA
jgi:hypothetical protein